MNWIWIIISIQTFKQTLSYIPPNDAKRLYDDLSNDYDKRIRPTLDYSWKTTVNVMILPNAIIEFDTATQNLHLSVIYSFSWFDPRFIWNSSAYSGIDTVHLALEDVWHPVFLVSVLNKEQNFGIGDESRVIVLSNGTVQWNPLQIQSFLCVPNITLYPFDVQVCFLHFALPYFARTDTALVNVHDHGYALDTILTQNPQWHTVDISSRTQSDHTIDVRFRLRRRASFAVLTTIVPIVLLSILNACVPLVPVNSGEKGSIAVTVLLSYCVYMSALEDSMPPNSIHTSYLLVYMTFTQMLSAFITFFSTMETKMFIYNDRTHILVRFFGVFCRVYKRKNKINEDDENETAQSEITKEEVTKLPITTPEPEKITDEEILKIFKTLDIVAFCVFLFMNICALLIFAVLVADGVKDNLK